MLWHCGHDYEHPFYMQVPPILTGTLLLPLHLPTTVTIAMPHLLHRINLLVIISRFFLLNRLALAEELVLINNYDHSVLV